MQNCSKIIVSEKLLQFEKLVTYKHNIFIVQNKEVL